LISIVVAYVLAIVGSYILFKVVSCFMQVRASENEEVSGIDICEHGERAYNQSIMSANTLLSSNAEAFASENFKSFSGIIIRKRIYRFSLVRGRFYAQNNENRNYNSC